MKPIQHTSHGVPLEEYVLTRQDHRLQKDIEAIHAYIKNHIDEVDREEAADSQLRAARRERLKEAWQILTRNPTPDHELMRWRIRLYCGHIVETRRHVTFETPTIAGSRRQRCQLCGMDPTVVVAWEPLGLVAQPP